MTTESSTLRFQPKARIIRTIGDQLISGPEAALIELVKNAYDADASFVRITFHPPLGVGEGRIAITDDGHGMSLDDIRLKWMEPATAAKTKSRTSLIKSRRMMGSKGIGRFAAAKLGKKMSLTSTFVTEGFNETVLIPEIDWSVFSEDVYLSDIAIDYVTELGNDNTGTTIEILDLNEAWTREKMARLHLELRRLVSPIAAGHENENDFRIILDLSSCTKNSCGFDGTEIIAANESGVDHVDESNDGEPYQVQPFPLLTTCDYELEGTFDDHGQFTGTFEIRRAGRAPETIELNIHLQDDESGPGRFKVHLFLFDREAASLKNNMKHAGLGQMTAGEARQLLDSIAGIAIYRDGFRIRPYGDPQNDWLALDSRRVQDPSLRIGQNQVVGYITIEEEELSGLVERSSREGLEENSSFRTLTRLVTEILARVVEPRRYKFRTDTGLSRKRGTNFDEVRELLQLKQLRKFVENFEPLERLKAEKTIDNEVARLTVQIDDLQERQRVLEAKSSLGAIIGEVLHEGGPPAAYIAKTSNTLIASFKRLLGLRPHERENEVPEFLELLDLVRESGRKLEGLFRSLRPLAGGKRGKPKTFYPVPVLHSAGELFFAHDVEIIIEKPQRSIDLFGFSDDLSTAVINLLGNSIHWLEDAKIEEPKIEITILREGKDARILIQDNGPGVPEEFEEQIFDVGFTLKHDGTGLGLNIAREALARSGGSLFYHRNTERGALFEIRFPAVESL